MCSIIPTPSTHTHIYWRSSQFFVVEGSLDEGRSSAWELSSVILLNETYLYRIKKSDCHSKKVLKNGTQTYYSILNNGTKIWHKYFLSDRNSTQYKCLWCIKAINRKSEEKYASPVGNWKEKQHW